MDNDSLVCSCHRNGGTKIHNYFILETLLPIEYNYVICTYYESTNHSITSRFHLNCRTKTDAGKWLEKCSTVTKLNFSIDKQDNNTIHARCPCKGTQDRCKTTIELNLAAGKANATNASTTNRSILHEHPTTVIFHYTHDFGEISNMLVEEIDIDEKNTTDDNYKSFSIDDKKKPKPKTNVVEQFVHEKLYTLYDSGRTPKQIYSQLKNEIFELFAKHNTDKIQRPGMKWVYEQYYNYLQHKDDLEASKKTAKSKKKLDTTKKETVTNSPLINSKINELCKKYVPILPASSPKPTPKPEPVSPCESPKVAPIPEKTSSSLVIKPENLNLIPLKLASNDKVPEQAIASNSKDHLLKLIRINDPISQNISLPSGVDGIIILTNPNNQLAKPINDTASSNVSLDEPTAPPKKQKHPRKPCLNYEDPGEIVFSNRLEDLFPKTKKVTKKATRKSARIADRKKRKKVAIVGRRVHKGVENSRKKEKKIVRCEATSGIENIICTD